MWLAYNPPLPPGRHSPLLWVLQLLTHKDELQMCRLPKATQSGWFLFTTSGLPRNFSPPRLDLRSPHFLSSLHPSWVFRCRIFAGPSLYSQFGFPLRFLTWVQPPWFSVTWNTVFVCTETSEIRCVSGEQCFQGTDHDFRYINADM